jgi:hypothetical protein
MSLSLGQTLAGLLNATFGNAVEIIVGIVALFKGEVRIVQTSVCTRPEALLRTLVPMVTSYRCSVRFYQTYFWFWAAPSLPVCWGFSSMNARAQLTRPTAGIFIPESEFSVTAAQTLVFHLCGSLRVLI